MSRCGEKKRGKGGGFKKQIYAVATKKMAQFWDDATHEELTGKLFEVFHATVLEEHPNVWYFYLQNQNKNDLQVRDATEYLEHIKQFGDIVAYSISFDTELGVFVIAELRNNDSVYALADFVSHFSDWFCSEIYEKPKSLVEVGGLMRECAVPREQLERLRKRIDLLAEEHSDAFASGESALEMFDRGHRGKLDSLVSELGDIVASTKSILSGPVVKGASSTASNYK